MDLMMATCVCPIPRTECPHCEFACEACVDAFNGHPRSGDVYHNDGIGEVTLTGRNKRGDGWTTSNPAVGLMDSGFASGHHKFVKAGPAPDLGRLKRAATAGMDEDARAIAVLRAERDLARSDLATERARSAGLTRAMEVAEPSECDNCGTPIDGDAAATSDVCWDCWRSTQADVRSLKAALEVARGALRAEVGVFAQFMEQKLRENDHKDHWCHDEPSALLRRLRDESQELEQAIQPVGLSVPVVGLSVEQVVNIGREAADVANFAMMIADVCGALDTDIASRALTAIGAVTGGGSAVEPCAGCATVQPPYKAGDAYCIRHPPAALRGTPGARMEPSAVDLHGKMMTKAEEMWRCAETAEALGDTGEAEQWEACAMVVEECAKMVAATPVAQRRPAREAKLLEMGQACLDWAKDTGGCHFCCFDALHLPHDEDCPVREYYDLPFEADRRGKP